MLNKCPLKFIIDVENKTATLNLKMASIYAKVNLHK